MLEAIKLKLVTFMLPEAYMEGLDRLVGQGMYQSRSAAIRLAVRDLLKRELWRERGAAEEEVATRRRGRVRRPHAKLF